MWDDDNNIVNNTYVKESGHIKDLFTKDLVAGSGTKIGWYRPFLLLTYTADYRIWGLNPAGFHVVNILLHIVSAFLLFCFAGRLLKNKKAALIAGLLFLAHPVQTEAVSYISGRADLLMVLFTLVSLLTFKSFQETQGDRRIVYLLASLASFWLALLSKESAIVLPLILVLFILTFGESSHNKLAELKSTLPFGGLAILYLAIRLAVLGSNNLADLGRNLFHRILVFLKVLPTYWQALIWPSNLHYHFERKLTISSWDKTLIISLIIIATLIFIVYKLRHKNRVALFGLGWFFLALLPVSGILIPINFVIGERWLYFAGTGIFLIAGVFLAKLWDALPKFKKMKSLGVILFAAYIISLGVIGIKRNVAWRNGITLLQNTLAYAPNDPKLRNSLGLEYIKQKRDSEALREFKTAALTDPSDASIHYNLSIFYLTHQMSGEAITELEKMINLGQNLEFGYNMLADLTYKNKKYEESAKWLEKLSKLTPGSWQVYYKLAIVYNLMGAKDKAVGALNMAVELNPDLNQQPK